MNNAMRGSNAMTKIRKRTAVAALAVCAALGQVSARAVAENAEQVVRDFWVSQIHGKTLTRDGWLGASRFFVRPSLPGPAQKILIIPNNQGWGIQQTASADNWAEVEVGTTKIGQLDAALRFEKSSQLVETGTLIRFELVRTTKHWELTPPYGAMGPAISGPPTWRIACAAITGPWVTLDTAIRYVTEQRNESKSDAVRKNAEEALAALEKLQR